jgi:hypothetical protein
VQWSGPSLNDYAWDVTWVTERQQSHLELPYRAQCSVRKVLMASIACLTIAVSSTTNLEIDMSKPRLLLIHCSNGIRPGATHRERGRSFRPLVIHGRAQTRSAQRESSWEAALELINLGFLISYDNYLAFLRASIIVLEACNRMAPES